MRLSPRQLIGLATICMFSGCALLGLEMIVGSGVKMIEQREVASFTSVGVSGAVNAVIVPGDECQVVVEGDDNLVPLVRTVSEGGHLSIFTEGVTGMSPKVPLLVSIVCPQLTGVSASGASEVEAHEVATESMHLQASGASELELSGTCVRLDVEISGASEADLSQLIANHATVSASGASELHVHALESITGSASGASDIEHSGTDNVQISTSGASDVSRR